MNLLDKLADRHQRLHHRHEASFTGHAKSRIIVEGDAAYLRSRTGQITWAMTLNLLARLYKGVDEFRIAIEPGIERL